MKQQEKITEETVKNTPEIVMKSRAGKLSTTIFQFTKKDEKTGKEYNEYSTSLQVSIPSGKKDAKGDTVWNNSNIYIRKDDLQRAILVLVKAQEFLYLNE